MSIKQAIAQIDKEVETLLEERKVLQNSCKHRNYVVGEYNWRMGSSYLTKICAECGINLGMPSDSDFITYNTINKDTIFETKTKVEGCHCWECAGSHSHLKISWQLSPLSRCPECDKHKCNKAEYHGNECSG